MNITVYLENDHLYWEKTVKWAYVAHYTDSNHKDDVISQDYGALDETTGNRAYIHGLVEFLKNMTYLCEKNTLNQSEISVLVKCDATYLTGMAPQVLSGKKDVYSPKLKNKDLWEELLNESKYYKSIVFEWWGSFNTNKFRSTAKNMAENQ